MKEQVAKFIEIARVIKTFIFKLLDGTEMIKKWLVVTIEVSGCSQKLVPSKIFYRNITNKKKTKTESLSNMAFSVE